VGRGAEEWRLQLGSVDALGMASALDARRT